MFVALVLLYNADLIWGALAFFSGENHQNFIRVSNGGLTQPNTEVHEKAEANLSSVD